ncbi:MAG: hypothetical protein OJF52_003148 [Nitrospira sp.]|nr:MAG: hypothetical protein OJF52_003148 [Nitrospira sp.]
MTERIHEAAEVLRGTDRARDPAGEAGTQVEKRSMPTWA